MYTDIRQRRFTAARLGAVVGVLASLLAGSVASGAEFAARSDAAPQTITAQDAAAWKVVVSPNLSPDGKWFVYSTVSTTAETGDVEISLIELARGTHQVLKGARRAEFAPGAPAMLIVEESEAGKTTSRITLRNLSRGNDTSFAGVNSYSLDPMGTRLALIDDQGLKLQYLSGEKAQTLLRDAAGAFDSLTWSPRGSALALFRHDSKGTALLTFRRLGPTRSDAGVFDTRGLSGFPEGHEWSGQLRWREDDNSLYVGLRQQVGEREPSATGYTPLIWRSTDDALPQERAYKGAQGAPEQWILHIADRKIVRLDASLTHVEPQGVGRDALGYDISPYGWQNRAAAYLSVPQTRDYYFVDLNTGARRSAVRGLSVATRGARSVSPQLSPDGRWLLYQDNHGDYVAYDWRRQIKHILTAGLPTKFFLPENDPRKARMQLRDDGASYLLQGWSKDGRYVLISDNFDVWALPLDGSNAVNLTGDGRTRDIRYRRIDLRKPFGGSDIEDRSPVDLAEPLYFDGFDIASGKRGLLRKLPDASALEPLRWEFADIRYLRAAKADVYIYSRESSNEPRDYYRVGEGWKPGERLTDVNPQQRRFHWPPPAKYITYTTSRGDVRHGLLYLPLDYVPGQKYPTIVQVYTDFSSTIHDYRVPFSAYSMIDDYQRSGYGYLLPDIVPRIDDAGAAAVEAVEAAVEVAIGEGADPDRFGIMGHSYGAYETLFIASQTKRFKAAVAIAGMSNLWSHCGALYGSGQPQPCEVDQPYLGGPWWEHWDAYLKNSPLYHASDILTPLLLVHGDKDTAVDFSQSVELFNTMRRLGRKNVVLLQYPGADHNVNLPGARNTDDKERVHQFFDHFLKGAVVPDWWQSDED